MYEIGAGQVRGAISTGQDHLGALQACRGGEQTLGVQRQAIEHLFEIDFGTQSLRSIPLRRAHTLDFLLPIREISTEKFERRAKISPAQSQ
jgi:hypothetical protein